VASQYIHIAFYRKKNTPEAKTEAGTFFNQEGQEKTVADDHGK
jgi:hypothetical protein